MAQAILSPTPIGPMLLRADGDRLTSIRIGTDGDADNDDDPVLREALAQLSAWFSGRLSQFNLPLAEPDTPRGTAHRQAIADIPYADTASYGAIARMIGSSPRAVGQACRRNPFPIVVPCHRVIGAGGTIGHYSGGAGIATKLWLLRHEQDSTLRKG